MKKLTNFERLLECLMCPYNKNCCITFWPKENENGSCATKKEKDKTKMEDW